MESLNIIIPEPRQVRVERQPVTDPAPGDILVRTHRSLISTGTELNALLQRYTSESFQASWMKYPFIPGYSSVGTVIKLGEGVTEFSVGDRVASRARHMQYAAIPAWRAVKVLAGVSDEDAAFWAIATIVQNGVRAARHELGDVVVVIGLGLLGQLAVQYARVAGAREVIAIDLAPSRLAMAAAHGATVTAPTIEAATPILQDLTAGRLADVVYEVTGHPKVLAPACSLARRMGSIQLLGTTGEPNAQHLSPDFVSRGLKIVAAHDNTAPKSVTESDYWTHPNMGALFFQYLLRNQMRVQDMITHRFKPADARAAYDVLINTPTAAMGVIFDWS